MSRNIVPRVNKGADLGTPEKNWNRIYADNIFLSGDSLKTILNNKADLELLMAKGDLYTATGPGTIARLPVGPDGYVLKANSGVPEGLMWGPAGARQELTGDVLVLVGETGDFPTINDALGNIVALYYPKYISGSRCPRVTIKLLPGFIMAEQVLVESLDLSWITITSDEPETLVVRSALTTQGPSHDFGGPYSWPVFGAYNGGFLPIIGQLFNMDSSGSGAYLSHTHGVFVFNNSRAIVLSGCGVKHSVINIYAVNSSIVEASGANLIESSSVSIQAINGSIVNAPNITASASGANNVIIARYNSIVNVDHGTIPEENTCRAILAACNSFINANDITITGCQAGIKAINNSIINAKNASITAFTYPNTSSIVAEYGSFINAQNANVEKPVYVRNGSIVNANGLTGTLMQTPNIITKDGIIFQATE